MTSVLQLTVMARSQVCYDQSNSWRVPLHRYLRRVVSHPTMLQDPDVREFLEKEEVSSVE